MTARRLDKEHRPAGLERLLEDLQNGTLDDASDLSDAEIELLRRHYGQEEDLQDLIDRLRGSADAGR